MAPENDFQEPQFPDTRQKVDGLSLFENGSPDHKDNAANAHGKRDQEPLQPNRNSNIRKSLAWDSAFFTSPGVLDPEELFQTLNLRDVENSLGLPGNWEQNSVPSDSLKAERTNGTGKCDPRQSLAWDSAFFTSAGVLEPDELSMMNKGFEKTQELWRSVESHSTIDRDGSPLTSLEIDLFEDRRAASSSNLRGRLMKNMRPSKQVVDASSQVRMKSIRTSRGKSVAGHGLERVTHKASVSPRAQRRGAGTREIDPKHGARAGELHLPSSLKPPQISKENSRISTAPTQRTSSGINHVKLETQNSKAISGNCLDGSKEPGLGVSPNGIRRSFPSPGQSLLSSSSAMNESTIYSSPYSKFCGSAAVTSGKSPLSSSRTAGTKRAAMAVTGLTYRIPPKYTTEKVELEESKNPTFSLSMSKSSSCTSPASSVDGCFSESSSTSVTQEPYSKESSYSVETHQPEEPCLGYESRETSSPIQNIKISRKRSPVPSDVLRTIKPSILRRPSPKIGFFDRENPTMPTINRAPQFHSDLQSTLSKSGTGRTESTKLQHPRSSKRSKNMKIGPQQTRMSCPSPVQFQETENDFLEVSAFPGPLKNCSATTSGAQINLPHMVSSKCSLKEKKVGEDQGQVKAKKQSSRKHENADVKSPEMNLRIPHEDDKENLCGVKKKIDGFSRNTWNF